MTEIVLNKYISNDYHYLTIKYDKCAYGFDFTLWVEKDNKKAFCIFRDLLPAVNEFKRLKKMVDNLEYPEDIFGKLPTKYHNC